MKSAIRLSSKGNFSYTESFFKKASKTWYLDILTKYGDEGVAALQKATPIDTGKTANSWGYKIIKNKNGYSIIWFNNNLSEGDHGAPVVVLLYYGHITKTGGYVEGRDFITPAIRPIFDKIANEAWKELNV